LTETLCCTPGFQFFDHRVERLVGHQTVDHADSASH
jgi:hypothetical protein